MTTKTNVGYAIRSFRNRDYLALWLGNLFMMCGMLMQTVAQGYLVYDITHSGMILGIVSSGYGIPILLFAVVGGAAADRFERKHIIQIGQGISAALALFIAFSITTETLTWIHLLGVSMIQGVILSFIGPARVALVPELVSPEESGNAIGLLSAGHSACTLVGPAAAGVIYALMGPDSVYYIVTGLAVIGMLCTTIIRYVPSPTKSNMSSVSTEVVKGTMYIWNNNVVRVVLITSLIFILLVVPFHYLIPVMIVDVYHLETVAQGILVSMLGLGSLTGALIVSSLRNRQGRGLVIIVSGLISGIVLLLVAAIPVFQIAVALIIVLGLGYGVQWTQTQIVIMEKVEDQFRGRVMSILIMIFGLIPIAVLPAGFFSDLAGPRLVTGFLGSGLFICFILLLVTQKDLRELE